MALNNEKINWLAYATVVLLAGLWLPAIFAQATAVPVDAAALPWDSQDGIPDELKSAVRWKTLVGRDAESQPDLLFGELEIAPFGIYSGHKHPSPEVYYVISGRIQWTVGDKTFVAEAGTTIYTPPDTSHRMENLSDTVARTVWVWWAPGGDRDVFKSGYQLTESLPVQPETARFRDP